MVEARSRSPVVSGLSAFPLTPMNEDRIDESAFVRLVQRLASSGVDSITVLGSTGSYAYLTVEQRARLLRVALEHAGNKPVLVSVGAVRTSTVLALLEDAQNAGAAGVLLAPVSYQPLQHREVLGLYQDATASLDVPLVVYDNPGTTHFTFDDDLYAEVAALPGVASIKIPGVPETAAGAARRITELRRVLPDHVTVGVSGDSSAALGLNAGCDGWYSVVGGTLPAPAVTITRAALNGEHGAATAESGRLQPLWDLFAAYGSLRVVASIAAKLGLTATPNLPRPILPLDEQAQRSVAEVVDRLKLN